MITRMAAGFIFLPALAFSDERPLIGVGAEPLTVPEIIDAPYRAGTDVSPQGLPLPALDPGRARPDALFRAEFEIRMDRLADLDQDMRAAELRTAAILDQLTAEPDPARQRELKTAFDAASADLKSIIALFNAEVVRLGELQPKDHRP